jgi:WhiB family transcriptional regulator, redox-sensing transcriptional regulator
LTWWPGLWTGEGGKPLNVVGPGLAFGHAHAAWSFRACLLKALSGSVEGLDMTSLAMSAESAIQTTDETDVDSVSSVVVQLLRRPRWQTVGACRGERVEMFIPDRGGPTARAKQLCARCTVRAECLRYALAVPDLVGYWAGTNERERRKLRAASRREKASA